MCRDPSDNLGMISTFSSSARNSTWRKGPIPIHQDRSYWRDRKRWDDIRTSGGEKTDRWGSDWPAIDRKSRVLGRTLADGMEIPGERSGKETLVTFGAHSRSIYLYTPFSRAGSKDLVFFAFAGGQQPKRYTRSGYYYNGICCYEHK